MNYGRGTSMIAVLTLIFILYSQPVSPVRQSEYYTLPNLDHFAIIGTVPANIIAGIPFDVTIEAQDLDGNPVGEFEGVLAFSSSDSQAGLPVDDGSGWVGGTKTFTVVYKTAGTQNFVATEEGYPVRYVESDSTSVKAGGLGVFEINGVLGNIAAGNSMNFSVAAYDSFHNLITDYAGIATFVSTDTQADLPVDDGIGWSNGQKDFAIVYKTSGIQFFTVTDGAVSTVSAATNVTESDADRIIFTIAPPDMLIDSYAYFQVKIVDRYGNPYASGIDVHLTSGSGSGSFHASENGPELPLVLGESILSIPSGSSTSDFWYLDNSAGLYTITAFYENLTQAVHQITVNAPQSPPPPQGGGGAGDDGYIEPRRTEAAAPAQTSSCPESWTCDEWSDPANSCGTRRCIDTNNCKTALDKPAELLACPVPAGGETTVQETGSTTDETAAGGQNADATAPVSMTGFIVNSLSDPAIVGALVIAVLIVIYGAYRLVKRKK